MLFRSSVSAYPSSFNPNEKFANPRRHGVPAYEPMLKAGGSWECELVVPDDIRQTAGAGSHGAFGKPPEHDAEAVTWILEVSSQVIFSSSVAVGYEVAVARDRKSLSLSQSLPIIGAGRAQAPQPGTLTDLQQSAGAKDGHHPAQPRGVFSRAVRVTAEDTASLWSTPRLPGWDDAAEARPGHRPGPAEPAESVDATADGPTGEAGMPARQSKVHLVILTHGLHSNLGADMLFMKESIDAAARQARLDARARRSRQRRRAASSDPPPPRSPSGGAAGEPDEGSAGPDVGGEAADSDKETAMPDGDACDAGGKALAPTRADGDDGEIGRAHV